MSITIVLFVIFFHNTILLNSAIFIECSIHGTDYSPILSSYLEIFHPMFQINFAKSFRFIKVLMTFPFHGTPTYKYKLVIIQNQAVTLILKCRKKIAISFLC